ncbi:hypothetical protein [Natronomonas sp. LN261]|uniref:hypothetical protein n=1 Tax=Natronomonas sp. LN261 TaxID=2750669 RepID=UPI0015EF0CBA|nr:hypothetical protein [Natronomonas sp. LN261]
MELRDGLIRVGYESSLEPLNDNLGEVEMTFIKRIDRRWAVDRLGGLARAESLMARYADAEWAQR